jgi:hypothetical protein
MRSLEFNMKKYNSCHTYLSFALGFFAALFLMALALALWKSLEFIGTSIYYWQPLIAGLIALLGAILTVASIENQISKQQQQEDNRRVRRHYAARAGMPVALSELLRYTENTFTVLKAIADISRTNGRIQADESWIAPEPPGFPANALSTLQTCIESAEPKAMPIIAQLIEKAQILHSRQIALIEEVSNGSTTIVTIHNLNNRIADSLEFYIQCSKLFDYARRRSSVLDQRITQGEISTRAVFAGFEDEDRYPGLKKLIERSYGESHK